MKKTNIIQIILISAFIITISSIFLTAQSSPDIDPEEFVQEFVGELDTPGFMGNYYTNPSFRVKVDYNISDYEFIRSKVQEIISRCKEHPNATQCANDTISQFNLPRLLDPAGNVFEWSLNCDEKEDMIFNDFVDFISGCRDSLDENCTCRLDDYSKKTIEEHSLEGEYEILINKERIRDILNDRSEDNIRLKMKDPDGAEHTIKDTSLKYLSGDEWIGFDSMSYYLGYKDDKKDHAGLKFYYQLAGSTTDWNKQKSITILKNSSTLILIKDSNTKKYSELPECTPLKKYTRVCVKNTGSRFTIYDEKKEKIDNKPVTYRFALFFEDITPPPKITGLDCLDTNQSENNITIRWDASTARDAKEYNIYFNATPFANISEARKIMTIAHKKEIPRYNITISVEEDKKPYYFAVTAVDFNRNEDPGVEPREGISEDDLAPGPVSYKDQTPTLVSDSPYTIKLEWEKPPYNIDGSTLKEDDNNISYSIYYFLTIPDRKIDTLDILPQKSGIKETSEMIEGLEKSKLYYFAVIAFDEEGNPGQDFLNKLDMSDNRYGFTQVDTSSLQ